MGPAASISRAYCILFSYTIKPCSSSQSPFVHSHIWAFPAGLECIVPGLPPLLSHFFVLNFFSWSLFFSEEGRGPSLWLHYRDLADMCSCRWGPQLSSWEGRSLPCHSCAAVHGWTDASTRLPPGEVHHPSGSQASQHAAGLPGSRPLDRLQCGLYHSWGEVCRLYDWHQALYGYRLLLLPSLHTYTYTHVHVPLPFVN